MSGVKILVSLLILLAVPMAAHAAAGAVTGSAVRDWAPCALALAALGLRVRLFGRRNRRSRLARQ